MSSNLANENRRRGRMGLAPLEAEKAAKPKKVKPLTKAQQRMLARYQREGFRLYPPTHRPSRTLQVLVERGLLKKIPGLLDETPQGYAAVE